MAGLKREKIGIMNIATINGARLGYWESGRDHLMEKGM
jgi:hypothetical protein